MTATGVRVPLATSSVGAPAAVTAVVVTAGRTPYLERTLGGLAAQTRRPARVLLVDVGGPDGAVAALDQAFEAVPGAVTAHALVRARSFGDAVSEGLSRLSDGVGEPATAWLWLLHDDSAPAPDALSELVRAVDQAPSVAVAGVKQRTWTDPERLLEVGVSTTRSGRRVSDVEPGELDQGQHDGRTDVLGVGLAGALVRTDVWADLRGSDPALGAFGDGIDLSRRARLAGHRVIVVPSAVVRHVQAGYLGLRAGGTELVDLDGDGEPDAADPRRSFTARRRSLVHSRLAAAPVGGLPFVVLAALLAAPVRALGWLVASSPGLAAAELRGGWGALARPGDVLRARSIARRVSVVPRRTLWPLQVGWRQVWATARDRRLSRTRSRRAPSELELGELATLATRRRVTFALLTVGLAVASLVALGPLLVRLLAGGRLAGGLLGYTTTTWSQLWAAASTGWVSGGLGAQGPADPLLRVLAVPAVFFGGNLQVVVASVLLGGVLLAGWGAWAAAGAATRSTGVRAWAALVWALAPSLLLAIDSGRVGAVLAHVALPWFVLGLVRALGVQRVDRVVSGLLTARQADEDDLAPDEPRPARPVQTPVAQTVSLGAVEPVRSSSALGGAAVAGALVVAGAPVLLVPLVVACVLLAALARRAVRLLLVPLPAIVLTGPLLVEAAGRGGAGWRLLLAEPGLPGAVTAAGAVERALGLPAAGTALVPGWVPETVATLWPLLPGALVLLLAVLALVRGGAAGRAVRLAWVLAAVGLAAATLVAAVPVVRDSDSVGAAWTGSVLSFTLAALLAAGLVGVDRVTERIARHSFGWRQQVAAVLVSMAVLVVGVGAVSWVWQTRSGAGLALQVDDGRVVPAVGQQAFAAPSGSRVLQVAAGAGTEPVRWQLLRADGVQQADQAAAVWTRGLVGPLTTPTPAAPDAATTEVATLVAALATGAGVDEAAPLAALGVAHVQVPALPSDESPTGAQAQARAVLVGRLDATSGLERVTSGVDGTLWRVAVPAASGGAQIVTSWARLVPAGADPRVSTPTTTATAVAGDGRQVSSSLAADDHDRTLVLAERSSPHWRASLGGRSLVAVDLGWRQAFLLPAGTSGTLQVRYDDPARGAWLAAQSVTGLLALLLAVPLHRRRGARR